MEQIKPCPSCGGEARIADVHKWINGRNYGYHRKYIQCTKCARRTMEFDWDDKKEMIETWNQGKLK